jgi:hypothetical protein
MGRCGLVLFAALLGAAGCSDPPAEPGLSCDDRPDPHCDHPIDRLLIPELRKLGLEPRDASAEELCRRMAFDLVGRGPTRAEQAACVGRTAGEIFDQLVVHDDYVRTQRRAWAEILGYDTITTWPDDLVDLDRQVEALYRDQITYPEFVIAVAMHPGFESLHPGDSWTTAMYSAFLGRTARADEVAAIRPLTGVWSVRGFCDRGMWWTEYSRQINGGADETTAVLNADTTCRNGKPEWMFNPCLCTPRDGFPGCTTTALGRAIELPAECVNPDSIYDVVNRVRAVDYTPGADSTCPDGTVRPECADRLINVDGTLSPFVPLPRASASLQAAIDGVGEALVARGDLWEATVNREARRLLGWWQATFRHPDSDLPEVRTLLADLVRGGDTIRELQRLLMTSQLYVQPADVPVLSTAITSIDPDHLPPWIAGPSKLLSGESWLDTVGEGVGLVPQRCDFRFVTIGGYGTYYVDPRLVDRRPSSLDDVYYDGYSTNSMGRLSGCNSEVKRPEVSNVGLAFNQSDIARVLCAYGETVTPAGWSGDLNEAATELVANLWHRTPRAGEIEALVNDMQACMAVGGTEGCADDDVAVRWLCHRLVDSVEFTTY